MMKKLHFGGILIFLFFLASQLGAQVSVTATAGTVGPTAYTTLKAAFDAINAGTHQGAINIAITGNTTETTSCVLNSSGAGSASYTAVTIKPTVNATISGPSLSGKGLVELNGADNVTIDGAIGVGGTTRNLTFTNTATSTTTYTMVIRVAVAATVVTSANNVNIKNCIINGSATGRNTATATSTTGSEATTSGIYAGGGASTSTATTAPTAISSVSTTVGAGATMNGLTISNNEILNCARGVTVQGSATSVIDVLTITNNTIGASTANAANTVYRDGISAQGFNSAVISGNTIRNLEWFVGTALMGIGVGNISSSAANAVIENNIISGVTNKNTGTFGAYGINLAGGNGHIIRNNFVSNINHDMTGGAAFSTTFGLIGIRVGSGLNHKIYHNSVHLFGARTGTPTTSVLAAAFAITATTLTGCDVRNNIFSNVMTGGTTSLAFVSMFLPSGGSSAMNLTLNSNAYYTGSTSGVHGICHVGTTYTSPNTATAGLFTAAGFNPASTSPTANLRGYSSLLSAAGTNDNASYASSNAAPFTSNADLHLLLSSLEIGNVEQKGASGLTGTGLDIDGQLRPNAGTMLPDMGADEVVVVNNDCTGTPNPGNTIASTTSICSGLTVSLSLQNFTEGVGVTYQWYNSNGLIEGATNSTYVSPALTANEYYYCEVSCASSNETGTSNTVNITVIAPPNGGTATGPATGVTNTNLLYQTTGSNGNLQWQVATSLAGTYSNIAGATAASSNIQFTGGGTFFLKCKASLPGCTDAFSNVINTVITLANDNACNALTLTLGSNGTFSNVGATGETGEVVPPLTSCTGQTTWCANGNSVVNSVWFKFTPAVSGKYSFALNGTLFDSQFALYQAQSCGDFTTYTLLAANDDITGSSPFNSTITPICLTGGVTYLLKVDGFGSTTASNWGVLVEKAANTAPVISNCPTNTTLCGTNNPTWTVPSVSDDCGNVQLTSNYNPGDQFPNGVTTVTYIATDADGATATCSFVVKVSAPINFTAVVTPAPCAQLTASVALSVSGGFGAMTYNVNNPPTSGLGGGTYTYFVTDANGCTASTSVTVVAPTNPCTAPTPVCGNIITVYANPGNLAYNGPGTADVYLIPAAALDAGTFTYSPGTLTRKVMRTLTSVPFNWTTNGACIDATPNGVYNNNDKGLVFRDCLPVTPADFNQIRNFDMTVTDQFGTANCSGRYMVVQGTPPGNTNAEWIVTEEALTRTLDGEFEVFPNPGTTQVFVNVSIENDAAYTLTVFDAMGREVKKLDYLTHGINVLDTQDLVPGIYNMVLRGGENINTIKWLKME